MPDIFVANKKSAEKDKGLQNKPLEGDDKPSFKLPPLPLKNTVHILSSFSKNPGDVHFQNQGEDEKVLLFVRRDFITNAPWVIISGALLIMPLLFPVLFNLFSISQTFIPLGFIIYMALFYYLLVVTYIFVSFIVWYFNISLVTNIRVLDVDFEGIVYKNVSSTKLNLVQDVSYSQTGVFRTLFDYGDVVIQTAGDLENFDFKAVPKPEEVVHIVGDLIGRGRGGV